MRERKTMSENENELDEAAEAAGAGGAPSAAAKPSRRRKTRIGVVVSDKANKTVTVKVERRFAHPLYGKGVARTKKFHAHDENNEYRVGDTVRIVETRPLSKLKRWRVVERVERQA
jgi:small subunit ribosomal protein S17